MLCLRARGRRLCKVTVIVFALLLFVFFCVRHDLRRDISILRRQSPMSSLIGGKFKFELHDLLSPKDRNQIPLSEISPRVQRPQFKGKNESVQGGIESGAVGKRNAAVQKTQLKANNITSNNKAKPNATLDEINPDVVATEKYIIIKNQDVKFFEDVGSLNTKQCSSLPRTNFKMRLKPNMTINPSLETIYPQVQNGHYKPANCHPTQKVAILIPFRNRKHHLQILLSNLIPILIKQAIDFTFFVVEQDLPTTFNKGVVYNAGFLEALKIDNFDCFILHDVDMIPLSEFNTYKCEKTGPTHFMSGVSKFNYQLLYSSLVGGVLGFTKQQYQTVNGFSNLYFGWGMEDDDMFSRITSSRMTIYRHPSPIGLYEMVKHMVDKRWHRNNERHNMGSTAVKRWREEGLNTVKYRLTSVIKKPLYIHVHIFVNMTEVYKTAPAYMFETIKKAWANDIENRKQDGTADEIDLKVRI